MAKKDPSMISTERRSWQGVLVSVVSAAFVFAGVALRDRIPWYATALLAFCFVAGILSIRGVRMDDRAPTEHLTIDDVGITRTARDLREHIAWVDIARVRIMTTDQGPYLEDVFFVIDSKNGEGCVIPHDLAVRGGGRGWGARLC